MVLLDMAPSCCLLIVPLAVWLFAGELARWSVVGVFRLLYLCCAYNSGIAGSCQWAWLGICVVLAWVSGVPAAKWRRTCTRQRSSGAVAAARWASNSWRLSIVWYLDM